jgi:hypothetical protein
VRKIEDKDCMSGDKKVERDKDLKVSDEITTLSEELKIALVKRAKQNKSVRKLKVTFK